MNTILVTLSSTRIYLWNGRRLVTFQSSIDWYFPDGITSRTMAPGESSRPSSHRPQDSSGRQHHKKRRSQDQRPKRPATDSGESREERRSRNLSADALAQLKQDNARRHKRRERRGSDAETPRDPARDAERERLRRERRERRARHAERAERAERAEYSDAPRERDPPREKPRRVHKEDYRDAPYEKPRKDHKRKKGRLVSGAILEEGRGSRGLRGGGWASSDSNSIEKEYLVDDPPKPIKKRKKLCR